MNTRKLALFTVVVLLVSLGAIGCASTRPASEQLDDAAITAKVKSKLAADGETNAFELDVDTQGGVVTLRGTVEDPADKAKAGEIAKNTEGVARVRNEIAIGDPTAGDHVDDAVITAKIKTKLAADPDINPFNIDVDSVRGGYVTLSGTVAEAEAKDAAERHAKNTAGVKEVKNEIQVREERTAQARPDDPEDDD